MAEKKDFERVDEYTWELPQSFRDDMRVPARLFGDEALFDAAFQDHTIEQLTIPVYGRAKDQERNLPHMADFKVVIHSNGDVRYCNFSGCSFRMHNPLRVYEIIVKHADELRQLHKDWEELLT